MKTLKKLGLEIGDLIQKEDLSSLRQTKRILSDLDSILVSKAEKYLDRIYLVKSYMDYDKWLDKKSRNRFLSSLDKVTDKYYDEISKLALRVQRQSFFNVRHLILKKFKKLFPFVKVRKTLEAVFDRELFIGSPKEFKRLQGAIKGVPQSFVLVDEIRVTEGPPRPGARAIYKHYYNSISCQSTYIGSKEVMIHELGHGFDFKKLRKTPEFRSFINNQYRKKAEQVLKKANKFFAWQGLKQWPTIRHINYKRLYAIPGMSGLLTDFYSMHNRDEFFACSCSDYVRHAKRFKKKFPEMFDFLKKEVFDGKDFLPPEVIPVKKGVHLMIGTGKITEEFKKFLAKQFEAGISSKTAIKTLSLEHQALVKSALINGIEKGHDLSLIRSQVMKDIKAELLESTARKNLEFNTMRILRTSHQQASNASVNYFAEQNRAVIKELERVANGRPCVLYYQSTVFTNKGFKSISSVKVGDKIITHTGRCRAVTKLHRRKYSGRIIEFKLDTKPFKDPISLTPDHPVLTKRGWIYAEDLLISDLVITAGTKCQYCGKFIPYNSNWTKIGVNRFCNTSGIGSCWNKYKENKPKWIKEADQYQEQKGIRFKESRWPKQRTEWFYSYLIFDFWPIKDLKMTRTKKPYEIVFNLDVIVAGTYILKGVVVHNCMACICLDGKRYPVGSTMDDHVQGMCSFSYIIKTPAEMGFEKIPPGAEKAWSVEARPYPRMLSNFHDLSEIEQRRIFDNKSLYDLWKREKFPIEKLVMKRAGAYIPATYKHAVANYPKWGGVSNPIAKLSDYSKEVDWAVIDPLDRSVKSQIILGKDLPKGAVIKSKYGGNAFGIGLTERMKISERGLSEANSYISFHKTDVPWYDFNKSQRVLGLYMRKASDKSIYYIVPEPKMKTMLRKYPPPKK